MGEVIIIVLGRGDFTEWWRVEGRKKWQKYGHVEVDRVYLGGLRGEKNEVLGVREIGILQVKVGRNGREGQWQRVAGGR